MFLKRTRRHDPAPVQIRPRRPRGVQNNKTLFLKSALLHTLYILHPQERTNFGPSSISWNGEAHWLLWGGHNKSAEKVESGKGQHLPSSPTRPLRQSRAQWPGKSLLHVASPSVWVFNSLIPEYLIAYFTFSLCNPSLNKRDLFSISGSNNRTNCSPRIISVRGHFSSIKNRKHQKLRCST